VINLLQALHQDRSTREFSCGGRRPGFWLVSVTFMMLAVESLCTDSLSFLLTPVVNDCRWRRAREKSNQRLLVPQMMVRNVPLA
jgi:hypothetical protein